MKTLVVVLITTCLLVEAVAQDHQQAFNEFNYEREEIGRKSMLALGGIAAVNILASTPLIFVTKDDWSYFNQMNVYWNVINLGIAFGGYFGAKKNRSKVFTPFQSFEKQKASERLFLYNSGLDIAYMTTGLFLNTLSYRINKVSDLLKGFGNSMMLQGGILLVFDVVMYLVHKKHGKKNLPGLFEKLEFSSNTGSIRF